MSAEHVGEAAWERLMMQELTSGEREAVQEHVLTCERCAKIYKGLLALEREARVFDAEVPRATSARLLRGPWVAVPLAIAAALLLFIAIGPFQDSGGMRGGATLEVVLESPAGSGPAPAAFVWKPASGARAYVVEVFDGEGRPLWKSAEVSSPPLARPVSVAGSAGAYFWRVDALGRDGVIGESKLMKFEVVP